MSFDLKIVRGDISISKDGRLETVDGTAKLKQDLIKIILTEIGSNKYHPYYGSKLGSLEIGGIPDFGLIESDIKASAEEAVRKLMALQRSQARRQFLSPSEVILSIIDIRAERDSVDLRAWNIFVTVLTERLSTISENVAVRINY